MVEEMKNLFDEIISPLMTTETGRRLGLALLIIAALLCLSTFTKTFYTWYKDATLSNQALMISSEKTSLDNQFISELPKEHLFGTQNVSDSFVPVTSLQLRLVGIFKSVPEKFSKIIISEAGQPGKVYQIGDSLPMGVRVSAITEDGVILENSGHLEKLPIQRSPLAFSGMPKPLSFQSEEKA